MYQSFISTSLEGGAQCARISTFRVPRPDKRRKYCALVLVFLAGLFYIAGSVVLWLIDCALTVVSTMCAGNRRRCPSFIYTTACDAAHGSRSSRILFLPGGRGAAALSPWRRGATGWAHARTHEERPARASTAKLLWCARNVLCVAHACGLAVCVRGQLLLACVVMSRGFCVAMLVAIPWAAQPSSPQTPNRPP